MTEPLQENKEHEQKNEEHHHEVNDHDHVHPDHNHTHNHDEEHDHDHHDHDHHHHHHSHDDDTDTTISSNSPRHSPVLVPVVPKVLDDGRVDCNPDDALKVVKTITKEGTGKIPPSKSSVNVHYVGTLSDGTKFDSSRDRNKPFSFELNKGTVIKGWELGVSTMKVGEIADFFISYEYAYGEKGNPPVIPPKSNLNFNIELISFEEEPQTDEEKIEFGIRRKNEGNEEVKKQEWTYALSAYERGLAYTQYLYFKDEPLKKQHKDLVISLFLNKALVSIKLDRFGDAFKSCDEVLKLDNNNGKAYYRRALCFEQRNEWINAKRDLHYAAVCLPNDKGIREEYEKACKMVKIQEEKEKKKFSNLFDKLKQEEEKEKEEREKKEKEEKVRKEEEEKRLAKEKKKQEENAKKAKEEQSKAVEEVKPVEETKPEEAKPEEAKPAEEVKPVEETKPEEAKPAEVKPVEETKPEEAKPAEAKPAEEVKPVEETKPDF